MSRKKKPYFTYEFEKKIDALQFSDEFRSKFSDISSEVDERFVKFIGTGSLAFDTVLRQNADIMAAKNRGTLYELIKK